jgi:hypothetical protein
MGTYELAVLAGLNVVTVVFSIFSTLMFLKARDNRRKYLVGKMILQDMGERAEVDMNFVNIIRKNFGPEVDDKRDDE